jgi:NAD(P)-dependent dehydrogenase (short-subunit alcohol dehydrogenase family)
MRDYRRMFDLTGKTALVVGPTLDGIGHAQALGLAQFGADVLIAGESSDDLGEISSQIRQAGRRSDVFPVDVTSEESVRSLVADVIAGHGRIDILINDFGTRVRRPAVDFPVDEWQKVMDYNIRGCFICCKEVGAEMVKNRSGKIINHSSVRAQYGFPGGYAAYSSSKGAIDALTKTLAVEWAPHNVFVNAIAPTFLRPNPRDVAFSEPDPEFARMVLSRIPLGRLGEPGDLVGPALFLASSASDFFTGHTLFVDGGVTSW